MSTEEESRDAAPGQRSEDLMTPSKGTVSAKKAMNHTRQGRSVVTASSCSLSSSCPSCCRGGGAAAAAAAAAAAGGGGPQPVAGGRCRCRRRLPSSLTESLSLSLPRRPLLRPRLRRRPAGEGRMPLMLPLSASSCWWLVAAAGAAAADKLALGGC